MPFLNFFFVAATPLNAQGRLDFSGVWRLDAGESRMIGGGNAPSDQYQLTWLVDHRDPEISVVVNVRDSQGSHEFSFRCTTDGQECVNELPSLREVRRITATWDGDALVMSQQANTPYGDFGFVARRGGWIRWQAGLREALQNTSSDLRLRAVAYTVDDRVGYIIGDQGYGNEPSVSDRGMFILTLSRGEDGQWLIAADLDEAIRP